MNEPITDRSQLIHAIRGIVLLPFHSMAATPLVLYFLVTRRFDLSIAEIENVCYQCWPYWFDKPDTFTRKLARFLIEQ